MVQIIRKEMLINNHRDLDVYKISFEAAVEIYELTKQFPREEIYSLTDQIRRSSRSVCANMAEAYRKKRYKRAFIAKLSDCEGETAETQTWLDFSLRLKYINGDTYKKLYKTYDNIIGKIVNMINTADKWCY